MKYKIPTYSSSLRHLVSQLSNIHQAEYAMAIAQRALKEAASDDDRAAAMSDISALYERMGFLKEGVQFANDAIALRDIPITRQNFVMLNDLLPETNWESHLRVRKELRARFGVLEKRVLDQITEMPDKIKVGYVSGDFRDHSGLSGSFNTIMNHDKSRFEVYLFYNTPEEDDVTRKLRSEVTGFINIAGYNDQAACEAIENAGIHILVDLSCVSQGNRLPLFIYKPAPIQVTCWGYATGTGFPEIDYFFADPVMVPEDKRKHFVEEVVYLSHSIHFVLPQDVSGAFNQTRTASPPAFGSFNRMSKVNDKTMNIWCELLHKNPDTKLVIKDRMVGFDMVQKRLVDSMKPHNLPLERFVLKGHTDRSQHVAQYAEVDVVLDPIPHTGGVSTMEALVAGLPVVTLAGDFPSARVSAFVLTVAGLTDWIATDEQQYIEIATELMAKRDTLDRNAVRNALLSSPLNKPLDYVRAVEAKYEWMMKRLIDNGGVNAK